MRRGSKDPGKLVYGEASVWCSRQARRLGEDSRATGDLRVVSNLSHPRDYKTKKRELLTLMLPIPLSKEIKKERKSSN